MPRDSQQLDSTIDVVTPENIAFHYQVAGPFRRLPAFLMDLLIRGGVFFLLVWILSFSSFVLGGAAVAIGFVAWFLMDWFYGGFFETFMNGQTPGKRVMGIRVMTVEGQPINGMQAVIRNVLRMADMFPVLSLELFGIPAPMYIIPTMLVGLIVMSLNSRYQRLGDLVCGTMVVIEERHWLTGVAKIEDARAYQLAGFLPADFEVSRTLAKALSHYVERRRFFSPARRREVARHLGEPLLAIFDLPRDTSHDLLLCALYYRQFIADRGDDERHLEAAGGSPFATRQLPPAQAVGAPVAAAPHPDPTGIHFPTEPIHRQR